MRKLAATVATMLLFVTLLGADTVEWVSPPVRAGKALMSDSLSPVLSENGQLVLFLRDGDFFLFDREEKSIRALELNKKSQEDVGRKRVRWYVGGGALNTEGTLMAFHHGIERMKKEYTEGSSDIFIYDFSSDRIDNITRRIGTSTHWGIAMGPVFSADGRYVGLTSNTTSWADHDMRPERHVYVWDRKEKKLELITRNRAGEEANRLSGDVKMSADARRIFFRSAATNLVDGIPLESVVHHFYMKDRETGLITQIDNPALGFNGNEWTVGRYDIDFSGQIAVFEGRPRRYKNRIPSLRENDLFVYDHWFQKVKRLTSGLLAGRASSPAVSGDGCFVSFVIGESRERNTEGGLIIYDRTRDTWKQLIVGRCYNQVISKDGRFMAVESDDPDMGPETKKGVRQIYVVANPFKQ